ncbi:MAG: hypothetical protein QNJ45_22810 [Ardenticatenaceae bacterium]|nr:hypothetical protein [Ardenticatenaceae bacterium]
MMGINTAQQRTLFGLRSRLLWRQFTGEKGRIISALIVLLIFGPMVLGISIASAVGYIQLEAPWPAQILGGVLVLLWVVWAVAPVFLGPINVSIDVSRLLVYPVTRRDMATAVLFGTLLDYPTFLVLPLFAAIVASWMWSLAWPFVLLGLPIAYLHMVIIGQIVMVGAGSILNSRRFRDLSIVVFSILGASCYFISQGVTRVLEEFVDLESAETFLLTWRPLDQLQWLPTGSIARAIEQGAAGNFGLATAWLGYSLLLLVGLGYVWLVLLDRLITGQTFSFGQADAPKAAKPKRARRSFKLKLLPEPLQSIVLKEIILTWRIPQRRIGMIQAFLLPVIFSGIYLFSGEFDGEFNGRWVGLFLIGYSYIPTLGFGSNTLAWEGQGLAMLFLTPASRRLIFQAKTVTSILLAALPIAFFTPLLFFISPPLPLLTGFFLALGFIGVGTAVVMLFSVWFPYPVNMDPKRPFAQPERRGGFIPTLMNVIGTPLLTGLLGIPLALPIALVWWFEWAWPGLILAVICAVYGLGVAWVMCGPAAEQLLKREPEILDALRAPEGD